MRKDIVMLILTVSGVAFANPAESQKVRDCSQTVATNVLTSLKGNNELRTINQFYKLAEFAQTLCVQGGGGYSFDPEKYKSESIEGTSAAFKKVMNGKFTK